jgi:hypothetical protein
MQRVQRHKNRHTTRAVEPLERATKRQCKKDKHQTKSLLALTSAPRAAPWRAATRQGVMMMEREGAMMVEREDENDLSTDEEDAA